MKKFLVLILVLLVWNSISFAKTEKELFEDGVFFFKKGMYNEAIDRFSELLDVNSNDANAFKNRGVAYLKIGKYDLAIQDFESAKAIFPELKDLHTNLGVAWYYKKECAKAIENYTIEIGLSPDNALAYFNRALCHVEQGKPDPALKDLDKTLELNPDFYWALCFKADLLAEMDQTQEAISLYEKALKIDPDTAYPKEKLAQLRKEPTSETASASPHQSSQGEPKTRQYTLQAGVFKNKANAERRNTLLIKKGYDSRVLPLKGKNDIDYYSVRIGTYNAWDEAKAAKAELQEKMKIESIIRKKGNW